LLLALAVSVITVVVLWCALVFGLGARTRFFLWTAVEIGWLAILWILWLASAAYTSSVLAPSGLNNCGDDSIFVQALWIYLSNLTRDNVVSLCKQMLAIQGLSWVCCIFLLIIWVCIVADATRLHSGGHSGAWTARVGSYNAVTRRTRANVPMGKQKSASQPFYGAGQYVPLDQHGHPVEGYSSHPGATYDGRDAQPAAPFAEITDMAPPRASVSPGLSAVGSGYHSAAEV